MSLISLKSIAKSYGSPVIQGLDMTVQEHARIGLIGRNGAGKSTLLRMLDGLEAPDSGDIVRRRGLRTAYLPQHVDPCGLTPIEVIQRSRPDLAALRAELHECELSLGNPEVYSDMTRMQRVLERQERLIRRIDELGGSGLEGEARSQLQALGLGEADLGLPMSALSGGQRKLVALATCLVQRPDLLLLDEPETHLDSDRRAQLEVFIRAFKGAVVMVSHDRYLLDETVSEIYELDQGRIRIWPGNYSAYTVARELELRRQQELYVSQQAEIARLEEAVRRFRHWAHIIVNERHARQARVKQMQIDRMEKLERPVLERRKMALEFRSSTRGGQKALELRHVSVMFDEPILLDVSVTVRRGERVGIVGPNGAGKSVLAKTLIGELEPVEGELWQGPAIEVGYFAQGNESLELDATPIDLVRRTKALYEEQAVAVLQRFLFSYEQVRQPVGTLSGGERSRLQLLLLMFANPNCLVLDEPTNHLDIDSVEVLESALEGYDGTVVFVSHDRYFLDRIADRVLEVRDGEVYSYEGGYTAWKDARARES